MERVWLSAFCCVCHSIPSGLLASRLGVLAHTCARSQSSVLLWLPLAFLLRVNMLHLVLLINFFITLVLAVLLLHLLLLLQE